MFEFHPCNLDIFMYQMLFSLEKKTSQRLVVFLVSNDITLVTRFTKSQTINEKKNIKVTIL